MARAIWKGAISFGLVSVPVGLHAASERRAELSFRLLHDRDKAPIDYRRFCTEEDVEVPWKEIVRGYEYDKGEFVVLTDEDFRKAEGAATQTIDIHDFVPAEEIDFAYFEMPYWLEPARGGQKAYVLLREALEKSGRVGIGTFVMRRRAHLAALRPSGHALMLTTLRFADEIRPAKGLDIPRNVGVERRQLDLARQLVDTLSGHWTPTKYHDTYREILMRAIQQKIAGKAISVGPRKKPAKVVSLAQALEASLRQSPTRARATRPHRRAA